MLFGDFGAFLAVLVLFWVLFGTGSVVLRRRAVRGSKPPFWVVLVVLVAFAICLLRLRAFVAFLVGSGAYSFLCVGICFLAGGRFLFFGVILAFSVCAPLWQFWGGFFGFLAFFGLFLVFTFSISKKY